MSAGWKLRVGPREGFRWRTEDTELLVGRSHVSCVWYCIRWSPRQEPSDVWIHKPVRKRMPRKINGYWQDPRINFLTTFNNFHLLYLISLQLVSSPLSLDHEAQLDWGKPVVIFAFFNHFTSLAGIDCADVREGEGGNLIVYVAVYRKARNPNVKLIRAA